MLFILCFHFLQLFHVEALSFYDAILLYKNTYFTGWKLIFKVAQDQSLGSASSMYDLWTGTYSMNEGDASAISFNAGTKTLKSSIIDNWSNYYINAVSCGEHQTNYRSDHSYEH